MNSAVAKPPSRQAAKGLLLGRPLPGVTALAAAARATLGKPVDAASLAMFRGLIGAVMCASTARFVAKGWVRALYVDPSFHFTYAPFRFVRPWPLLGMYAHFAVLFASAASLALGYRARLSALVFMLAFTYVELIDKASYLNHYYLVTLLTGMLVLLPSSAALSIDARRRPAAIDTRRPAPSSRTLSASPPPDADSVAIPYWMLAALRLQVGVVYFYAGVAKLNRDWLVEAQPLRIWLAARSDFPWVGPVLAEPGVAHVLGWTAAAFDLSVVGLLLYRRTRPWAFAVACCFHLMTGLLFPIGMFPWIMIASATVFFEPDWPVRLGRAVKTVMYAMTGSGRARPTSPSGLGTDERPTRAPRGEATPNGGAAEQRVVTAPPWIKAIVAVHSLIQLVLPLRQQFERVPSAWSNRGFDFSWNVMAAEKAGSVSFLAADRATGEVVAVAPLRYLTPSQEQAMARDPEMVRALALEVARNFREKEGRSMAVRAEAFATLNGRPSRYLLDPNVDLTGPLPPSWILPLDVEGPCEAIGRFQKSSAPRKRWQDGRSSFAGDP
ncbi:MAG TPA: HTTM domain-containing protein [Polyangiaceae bacterium]|nr:HTTM domain-containing protein [Polyangiaceae bacterium]